MKTTAILFLLLSSRSLFAQKMRTVVQQGERVVFVVQGYKPVPYIHIDKGGDRNYVKIRLIEPDFYYVDETLREEPMSHVIALLEHLVPVDSVGFYALMYFTLVKGSDTAQIEERSTTAIWSNSADSGKIELETFLESLPFHTNYCFSSYCAEDLNGAGERQLILKQLDYSPTSVSTEYFDLVADFMDNDLIGYECNTKHPLHIIYLSKTGKRLDYYYDLPYPKSSRRKKIGK